ncbi:MAG: PT domain-containing protein [Clostridiales bacterium]|nr:PT domain-containing protein [Clostridiales bacterium]
MKKFMACLLIVILIFPIAACKKAPVEANVSPEPTEIATDDPTAEPTASPVISDEPTAAPTEEPTASPEPTAVPTPTPEPIEHDFFAEAEKVAHINWGNGDHRIKYEYDAEGVCPYSFSVANNCIYIPDTLGGNKLLIYDLSTGSSRKTDGPIYINRNPFIVLGDKLITFFTVYDLNTMETAGIKHDPEDAHIEGDKVSSIIVRDGIVYAYLETSSTISQPAACDDFNGEYILDLESMKWVFRSVPTLFEKTNHKSDTSAYRTGVYLGFDADGNEYYWNMGREYHEPEEEGGEPATRIFYTVFKYSPDGVLLSYFEFDRHEENIYFGGWGYGYETIFVLADDGAIYYMLTTLSGIDIYRIFI